MGDAAMSVLVKPLTSRINQWLEEEITLVKGVKAELENVSSNLQTIQKVLNDAEKRSIKDETVRGWLKKLEDIAYEMDDVLDEWKTSIFSKRITDEQANYDPSAIPEEKISCCSLFNCFSSTEVPCLPFKQVGLRHDIAWKTKDINTRLDSVVKQIDKFQFVLNYPRPNRNDNFLESERMTTSIVDESQVYDRDSEKNTLLDKLLYRGSQEGSRIPIISIVGVGGLGKTTMAKLIYNDVQVGERFDDKIWVCVSDPFDVSRIAREIVEAIEKSPPNFGSKNLLLEHLKRSVSMKKFLLVLDDVWDEDGKKWEELRTCLKVGSPESRIIVTTRKEKVATVMGTTHLHPLGLLSKEACWSLFSQMAFAEKEENQILREIGEEIVQKCKGLPLAVKALGRLLRLKDTVEEWQHVLDSEIWQYKVVEVDLFPHLFLSYNELSPSLKRCFLYCSIFPKDCTMDVDDLIRQWMAQGYIPLSDGEYEMEQKGREYFDKLAFCSFFQDFRKDETFRHIILCKMHDIVHDFAQYLAKDECITIERGKSSLVWKKARHLYKETDKSSLVQVCDVGKLRTFSAYFLPLNKHFDLFNSLKCVRMLKLKCCNLETLPEDVGNLVHLRYLSLYGNDMNQLPESVCELYNLQTLDIRDCSKIRELPQMIGKLINLRHLLTEHEKCPECPASFEKLTNLRTLTVFKVGRKYCKLEYLKCFTHLQGELKVVFSHGLQETDIVADALKAELKNKKYIKVLLLSFSESLKLATEAVLEAFEPPSGIVKLHINSIWGIKYPSWLMKSLHNLRSLAISSCPNWSILPPLGQLPNLEKLFLHEMTSVKHIGHEFLGINDTISQGDDSLRRAPISVCAFPKLLKLSFFHFRGWEEWEDLNEEFQNTGIKIMPRLQELRLYNCPKLYELPIRLLQQISSLQDLNIGYCGRLQRDHLHQLLPHIPRIKARDTREVIGRYPNFYSVSTIDRVV